MPPAVSGISSNVANRRVENGSHRAGVRSIRARILPLASVATRGPDVLAGERRAIETEALGRGAPFEAAIPAWCPCPVCPPSCETGLGHRQRHRRALSADPLARHHRGSRRPPGQGGAQCHAATGHRRQRCHPYRGQQTCARNAVVGSKKADTAMVPGFDRRWCRLQDSNL